MPHTALSPGPYGPDLGPPGYGWNLAASSDSGAEKHIGHGEPHPERPVHGHIRSAARHHDIHPEISRRRRLVPGRLRRRDPSPLAHRERQLAVRRCPAPRSKYGSATVPTCPSSSIIAPTDARGRCRRCPRHRQARGCGQSTTGRRQCLSLLAGLWSIHRDAANKNPGTVIPRTGKGHSGARFSGWRASRACAGL
jgi:hypothetical protein